jgi:hypothetical protein
MNAPAPRQAGLALGIALMLVGIFLFVANDVLGKWLVATYGVGQILLVRSLAGERPEPVPPLPPGALMARASTGPAPR